MQKTRDSWELAYSPDVVRTMLLHFADVLPAYYARAVAEPSPVSSHADPHALVDLTLREMRQATAPLDAAALSQRIAKLSDLFLEHAQRLHSPHYIGHQVPAVAPVGALFDALTKATNQGLAAFEMGPFSMAAERALVQLLGERLGYDMKRSDGLATSGGTLANLTAVLAARHARYKDAWKRGLPQGVRPAIVCSAEAHYSIARAAGVLGIGTDQVLKVAVDSERRMRGDALSRTLDDAQARGLDVFCVVASACATPTGSFDALPEIAAVCADRGIWWHADGAHGASLLFSKRYRHLLDGIAAADSVAWDAHKMLFVPSLSTFLFYKDAAASYEVFEQDAPYLGWNDDERFNRALDGGRRTIECTKGGISVGLWGLIASCGEGVLEELVDRSIDVTRAFHASLLATDDFVPAHEPQCNILCFRHVPAKLRGAAPAVIGAFQKSLRAELLKRRSFYITSTTLDGVDTLRVTVINPETGPEHLAALVAELRNIGAALLARQT